MPETATLTVPEALGDEWGDHYYMQGHIEPALAVLAVVCDLAENVGDEEAVDFLSINRRVLPNGKFGHRQDVRRQDATSLLGKVRHVWSKPDPDNEEMALPCEPDDPAAEAWTVVDLVSGGEVTDGE